MKYTKEIINAMRTASYLIEPPASEVIGGLLDEIERLQAENRWRKYPDEKPEKEGIYLTITPEKNEEDEIIRMAWDGGNWSEVEYEDFYGAERFGVALWRPLPPAPEGEG